MDDDRTIRGTARFEQLTCGQVAPVGGKVPPGEDNLLLGMRPDVRAECGNQLVRMIGVMLNAGVDRLTPCNAIEPCIMCIWESIKPGNTV